ncbi:MAG TPA: hypothetical protein VGI33_10315 [Paenibacillus sp.]|jgi:ABC-type multidrug transport system ATPase subunit
MITGVLEMDEGTIEVNGISYQKGSFAMSKIGFCTQDTQLWACTYLVDLI